MRALTLLLLLSLPGCFLVRAVPQCAVESAADVAERRVRDALNGGNWHADLNELLKDYSAGFITCVLRKIAAEVAALDTDARRETKRRIDIYLREHCK